MQEMTEKQWDGAMAYAKKLADRIQTELDIPHHPTVARNRRDAYQKTCKGGIHQIIFGWECIYNIYTREWSDYKTITWQVWGDKNGVKGLEAIHCLVLHEVAHSLQVEDGGVRYGSVHNANFISWLRFLIDLYPYGGGALKELRKAKQDIVKEIGKPKTDDWVKNNTATLLAQLDARSTL